MIQIVETIGRTEHGNGVSRPYRCVGDDGVLYFVKTAAMGMDQMIKDWFGCSLATTLGLPVAAPTFVHVPETLAHGQPELVGGVCFGSREVERSVHCTTRLLEKCDRTVAAKILLYDRWTQNNDRFFSQLGGNANLLFVPAANQLVMIDEDNAFDPDFNKEQFWSGHGLREFRDGFQPETRHQMSDWLNRGLEAAPDLWRQLPPEWLEDDYGIPRTTLALEAIVGMLSNFTKAPDEFWASP